MYVTDWGASWIPVLDCSAQPEASGAWVWGAQEDKLWAVMCGTVGAEPTVGSELPSPTYVNMLVPALRAEAGERGALLRQHHMRNSAKVNAAKHQATCYTEALAKEDARLDSIMLRAFETELKNGGNVGRCIDMATQLQLVTSVENAARLAHSQNMSFLCEKLVSLVEARVKAKKRRLCELPAESTFVTDKEKDRMLRRLLAEEKSRAGVRTEPQVAVKQDTPTPAAAPKADPPIPAVAAASPPKVAAPPPPRASPPKPTGNDTTTAAVVKPSKAFNPFSGKAVAQEHKEPSTGGVAASPPKPPPKLVAKPLPAVAALAKPQVKSEPKSEPPHVGNMSPARDPFLSASQATDATTAAAWRDMDAPPSGGLSLRVVEDAQEAPSASVAAALTKRFRDDSSDDEETLRGFGKLLPRTE